MFLIYQNILVSSLVLFYYSTCFEHLECLNIVTKISRRRIFRIILSMLVSSSVLFTYSPLFEQLKCTNVLIKML